MDHSTTSNALIAARVLCAVAFVSLGTLKMIDPPRIGDLLAGWIGHVVALVEVLIGVGVFVRRTSNAAAVLSVVFALVSCTFVAAFPSKRCGCLGGGIAIGDWTRIALASLLGILGCGVLYFGSIRKSKESL